MKKLKLIILLLIFALISLCILVFMVGKEKPIGLQFDMPEEIMLIQEGDLLRVEKVTITKESKTVKLGYYERS